MLLVAEHLRAEALTRTVPDERDQFGRSSYNRYYYATFLRVRTLLGDLRPEWARIKHADVPEVLSGQVRKELQGGIVKAKKAGDGDLMRQCSRAKESAKTLVDVMQEGVATRNLADYHPEVPVAFSHTGSFALNNVSIKQANEWPQKANFHCHVILIAWRQIYG